MRANELAEIRNGEFLTMVESNSLHWYDFGLRMSSNLLLL